LSDSREPAGEEKGTGIRLNKLLDSNLFNQEFVPKRHKFHDGRAKSDISLAFLSVKRFGMEVRMKRRRILALLLALSISVSMNDMTVFATAPDAAGLPATTEQEAAVEDGGESSGSEQETGLSGKDEETEDQNGDGTDLDATEEDTAGSEEQEPTEDQAPEEEDPGTSEDTDDSEVPEETEPDKDESTLPGEDKNDPVEAEDPEEGGADAGISDNTIESDEEEAGDDSGEPQAEVRMMTFTDDTGMRVTYNANEEYEVTVTDGVLEKITYADGRAVRGVVFLPENKGITAIGAAFQGNADITYVKLPAGVTSIQDNAFNNCYRLQGIYLPGDVQRIGDSAFYRCTGLLKVAVPKKLVSIGNKAFYGNDRLFMIYAQDAVHSELVSIGEQAFYQCRALEHFYSDRGFVVPGNLESIGAFAFFECKAIKEINFNETVKTVGESAFQECNALKELVLSSKLEVISKNAFAGCNELIRVQFKTGNNTIGESAFKGCVKLSALSIPGTVRTIANYAFADCNRLIAVEVQNFDVAYGDSVFPNIDTLTLRGLEGSTTEEYTFGKKIKFVAYDKDTGKNYYKYTITYAGTGRGTLEVRDENLKDPNTLNGNKGVARGTKLYVYVMKPEPGSRLVADSIKCNGEPLQEEKGAEGEPSKLYFEMPIGGAYLTAEFENTAGNDRIDGLDGDVKVEISNGDVETNSRGEVTRVNLKAGQYTRMFLTDAKADHKAIPSSKITFSTTKKSVATVAKDGTIHAISAGQTDIIAKVTGTDGNAFTRVVRVAVNASGAVQIKLDASEYDARFVDFETSPLGNVQTAVVDKDRMPDTGLRIRLTATVYDAEEDSIAMNLKWTSSDAKVAKLSRSSSTVDDPSSIVTIPAGTNGEATIRVTATNADKKTVTQKFIIRVTDKTPRLVSGSLTINPNRTDGAVLQILNSYGRQIDKDSVKLVKYDGGDKLACRDFDLAYLPLESDSAVTSFRVTTSGSEEKNKAYSVYVDINGGTYELPLKISVKASEPKPKIAFEKKQPKLNYFYANDETEVIVNVTNLGKDKVADYELRPLSESEDNKKFIENFEVEYVDQDTCMIMQKSEELLRANKGTGKPVVTGYLRLYYEGYADDIYTDCKITIPAQRTAPSFKLNRTSDTFKSGCGEQEIELQLVDKKNKPVDLSDGGYELKFVNDGEDRYTPIDTGAGISLDDNGQFTLRLRDNVTKAGKVKLRLKNSSWAEREQIDFTYSVKFVDSVPKISLADKPGSTTALKSSTVTLNPNYPEQTVEFGLKSNQKGTEIADEQIFREKTTKSLAAYYQYLDVQYVNGVGTVTINDPDSIKDGTYTYVCDKAQYVFQGDERPANKITLKVKVKKGNPSVSVKGSLTLNNTARTEENDYAERSELSLVAKNLPDGYEFDVAETLESITCKTANKQEYVNYFDWELTDRQVDENGKVTEGKLAASMNQYCEKGTYRFSIKPAYSGGGKTLYAQKAVNFNLKVHAGTISIALSPKGKINLLDRFGECTTANSIVYTPSLKNVKDKVVGAKVYDHNEDIVFPFDGPESEKFEAKILSDGKIYVRPKEDAVLENNKTYKIYVWTELENYKFPDYEGGGGGYLSKVLSIKTGQILPKVKADRSSVNLYLSNKNYVATFIVNRSEAKTIGNVESIAFGEKDTNAQESFVTTEDEVTGKHTVIDSEQLEEGSLLVKLKLRDTVFYGCDTTNKLTMYVRFEGQGTNTPGTAVTMNVKINK